MVKLYDAAMVWFTESGTHQPDFMGYVKGKPFLYYYRMYMVEKPNAHKAFNTMLDDDMFGDSFTNPTTGGGGKDKGSRNRTLKQKQAMLQEVALSMSEPLTAEAQRARKNDEKLQLEQNIVSYTLNLLNIPDGQAGHAARTAIGAILDRSKTRLAELNAWAAEYPSPCKK